MNIRRILILLGLLGVIVLIFSSFGDPHKIIQAFQQVRWYVVLLVIITQLASYYCNARYYEVFFSISRHKVPLKRLYEAALATNFANQAIPSGGVAGTTYLYQAVKSYGVASGNATLAQVGRYIFTFLSYLVVLGLGFLLLFFSGDLDKVSVRFILFIMTIILAVGIIVLTVFSEKTRFHAFMKPILRFVNRFGHKVLRRKNNILEPERFSTFLDEFYLGYHEIVAHKGRWPALLWWSLGGNIAEVMTIYVVFVGFGTWLNPGAVITAYTFAIIASVGGIIINGFGVYEAGMIGTFAALGVPFALAFAAVLVYRILNLAIFLPPGLYFYRKHLRESS